MKEKRYTVKRDGKYYSGNGAARGFLADGIGACYSAGLDEARALAAKEGGKVVEVVHVGGFRFIEGEVEGGAK